MSIKKGVIKSVVSLLVSRLGSLISQILVGWYILAEDLGFYVDIYAFAAIFMSVKNAGLNNYLMIQKGEVDKLFSLCRFFNLFLAIILTGIGIFKGVEHGIIAVIFSISIILSEYQLKIIRYYSLNEFYKEIGEFQLQRALLQYGGLIALLLMDFDIYALAGQYLLITIFELYIYKFRVGAQNFNLASDNSVKLKFVIYPFLNSLSSGAILHGQFLALSFVLTSKSLGLYYFGFQLVSAGAQVFITVIRTLFTSYFSNLKDEPIEFRSKFNQSKKYLLIILSSIIPLSTTIIPFLVDWIWSGKWNESIEIIIYTSASLICYLQLQIIYSKLEAIGNWGGKLLVLLIDGFFTIFISFIFGYIYGYEMVVKAIFIYRMVIVPIFLYYDNFIHRCGRNKDIFFQVVLTSSLALLTVFSYEASDNGYIFYTFIAINMIAISVLVIKNKKNIMYLLKGSRNAS